MTRSYRGSSLHKKHRAFPASIRFAKAMYKQVLDLEAMRGEVHRFAGIVDRFGSAEKATGMVQTVCIRNLVYCRTNQPINPDHWWFRMRQMWMNANLKPGDEVIFIAKVQRCTKGRSFNLGYDERYQVAGFGSKIRSIIVKQR